MSDERVVKVQPWRFTRPGDSFESCWVGWLYLGVAVAAMMGLVVGIAIGVLVS